MTRRHRRKTSPLKAIQNKIWELCKQIIRRQHAHVCYTCGKKELRGKDLHTGHLLPKKVLKYYMKYDLRILRPQCQKCNLRSEGMGAVFYMNMLKREGKDYMDEIMLDYDASVEDTVVDKPSTILSYYQELYESYKAILNE